MPTRPYHVILSFVVLAQLAAADIRLPAVLSDNAVFQQNATARIWGWAEPAERISVTASWNNEAQSIAAGPDGRWSVDLKTGIAGGPYTVTIHGKNERVLSNIMLGEVWICSGQSNMEWSVGPAVGPGIQNHAEEIASAKFPNIRLFTVKRARSNKPADDCEGAWTPCSPETVIPFSATAYFFGRSLHQKLNVPIGLIETCWGGTEIELWTSEPTLRANPDFAAAIDERAKAAAANMPPEKLPHGEYSVLYNAMIAPLLPYRIRGVIWYQGESNIGRAYQYRTAFPAMIQSWRTAWGCGDFPFYYVQIAPFTYRKPEPVDPLAACPAAELREAQLLSLSVPNTGMIVTTDIVADVNDIHPPNKQDVGARLALLALAGTYSNATTPVTGPLYREMRIEGDKIRIAFKAPVGDLVARGGPLTCFLIAGEDRRFFPATAAIDGQSVVVSSPNVAKPTAVRFAWSDAPQPNLFNQAGLPASPFRTDDWPAATRDVKW